MATVAVVKRRALEELGVIQVGGTFQSQDNTAMGESYTEIYASLKELGLATWTSTGVIPNEVVPHIVSLVAMNRIDTYSVSTERYSRLASKAQGAVPGIRNLVVPPHDSMEEPTDY